MSLPGLTPEELKGLILSIGTHHGKRLLSPLEVARLFSKAISHGASREECASFVHLSGSDMVSRFLRLLDLKSFIQLSTDWRQTGSTISFTSAWKLSALPNNEQEDACIAIMAHQLRTKEVEQVIQLQQRSKRSFAECLSEVIGMRLSIVNLHVIVGAVTDNNVREWLNTLSQAQRDRVFVEVLTQTYPTVTSCSGRLGVERFSIVTNDQGHTVITCDSSFEILLTQKLVDKMGY